MSPYWNKISNIAVTLHGGASETITITGLYGNPTVTTNSDGSVNYQLPIGEFTFSGSVSKQSFTRNVTKDTTDVYVMPERSIYWYGNTKTISNVNVYSGCYSTIKTNEIYLYATNNGAISVKIDDIVTHIYNSLHIKYYASNIVGNREDHGFNIEIVDQSTSTSLWRKNTHNAGSYNETYDISSVTSSAWYIHLMFNTNVGYSGYCSIYEVWLE